jgi:hypothetical protein
MQKRLLTVVALLFALVVVRVSADTPVFYACAVGDWGCVNGKLEALESQTRLAQQEARYAAEAARQYKLENDGLKQRLASLEAQPRAGLNRDEVWSLAGDRIAFWQQQSVAYKDHWFYDQIYARWRLHECRNGQTIKVACP